MLNYKDDEIPIEEFVKKKRKGREVDDKAFNIVAGIMTIIFFIYLFMFMAFQVRNPKANGMAFWTEFKGIITFEKMECYQK